MKAEFPTNDVLATAVAVDRIQGFIRSGQGYTKEDGTIVSDNKTTIISRYFLLRLTYKFNNNKTKAQDESFH